MPVQITNRQRKEKIDLNKIEEKVERILKHLRLKGVLSILFCNDKLIKRLNKEFRGVDKTTDVLAFPYPDTFPLSKKECFFGEIVISIPTAKRQSLRLKHNLEEEILILLVHGIVHLLGYDHQTIDKSKLMKEKEKELLRLN